MSIAKFLTGKTLGALVALSVAFGVVVGLAAIAPEAACAANYPNQISATVITDLYNDANEWQRSWSTFGVVAKDPNFATPRYSIVANPQARALAPGNRPAASSIEVYARNAKENLPGAQTSAGGGNGWKDPIKLVLNTHYTYDTLTGVVTLTSIPDTASLEIGSVTVYAKLKKSQVSGEGGIKLYGLEKYTKQGADHFYPPQSSATSSDYITAAYSVYKPTDLTLSPFGFTQAGNNPIRGEIIWPVSSTGAQRKSYNVGFNAWRYNNYASYKPDAIAVYSVALDSNYHVISMMKVSDSNYTFNKATGELAFDKDNNFATLLVVSKTTFSNEFQKVTRKAVTNDSITIWKNEGQDYWWSRDGSNWTWVAGSTTTYTNTEYGNSNNGGILFKNLEPNTTYYFKTSNGTTTKTTKIRTLRRPDQEAVAIPFKQGNTWSCDGTIGGWSDYWGNDIYNGEYAFQTLFSVQLSAMHDSWGFSDDQDAGALWNQYFEGSWHEAMCRNHAGAETPPGWSGNTELVCDWVDGNAGVAGFHYWVTGFDEAGYQNCYGEFTVTFPTSITVIVNKSNDYPGISEGNASYSLEGACFQLLNEDGAVAYEGDTDSTGQVVFENIPFGAYILVEQSAPEGFARNDEELDVYGEAGSTVEVEFSDEEISGTPFPISKFDFNTRESTPQGNATFEGIVYEVRYAGGFHSDINSMNSTSSRKATWHLRTDASGTARFDSGHLAAGYANDDFFTKNGGRTIVCPLGTYAVREVYNPNGYHITDNGWHFFQFTVDGKQSAGSTTTANFDMESVARSHVGPNPDGGTYGPLEGYDAYFNMTHWYNIVWRHDITLVKADDSFRTFNTGATSQNENGASSRQPDDAQGNATLKSATYSIVNRSAHYVKSPQTGQMIAPGSVVCNIKTDANGLASTAKDHLADNGWGSWPRDDSSREWHGALAYGDYEVFEIEAPVGYMLGHYKDDSVTYYSMCTTNIGSPLLSGNLPGSAQAAFGFKNTDPLRNTYKSGCSVKRIVPSAGSWINADNGSGSTAGNALVKFATRDNAVGNRLDIDNQPVKWSEDTPQRGNIEVIKADDTLKTHNASATPSAADPDAQGDSTLEGAIYSVVNRSTHSVVSPETGGIVQPGQVICHIKTDASGFATTANSRYGWSVPDGWHGALPYGDYEVFEIEAPVGYMLGHWNNRDVTYYSMCTEHAANPLLSPDRAGSFGFAGIKNNTDNYENKYYVRQATVDKQEPDSGSQKWVSSDKVTVSFKTRDNTVSNDIPVHWSEDTVKRADLELLKADDTLDDHEGTLAVVDYAGRCKPQGDATLKDARFGIINRSDRAVVNPFGELVQPGQIVCYVYTDENGYASTKLTPERIAVNRWNQRSSHAVDGKDYAAGNLYATAHGWHGALAYGEYEIFEVDPPQGYLNGHWFEHLDTKILTRNAGMAIKGGNVGVKTHLLQNYDSACTYGDVAHGDNLDGVERNYQEIYPNSAHTWIDVSNAEVGKHPASNANADLVTFTRDAAQNGSSAPDPAGQQRGDPKEQRFEDTVIRGDLDLQKTDSDLNASDHDSDVNLVDRQGRAHLEGAVFGIYNRSNTVVVSPQTGKEVWPAGMTVPGTNQVSDGFVCTIITDKNGFASTKLTADRITINEWDQENVATYAPFAAGECFASVNGWHGSLAYGQYEIVEITPPTGYMMNKTWHGMAIAGNSGISPFIDSGNAALLAGKGTTCANAVAISPNSNDGSTCVRRDRDLVSFGSAEVGETGATTYLPWSQDAGSPIGYAKKAYTEKNKATWITDDVIRGGLRIGKIDRQNQQYKPQGKSTLETHIIGIFSTNPSPVTLYEPTAALKELDGFGIAGSKYQTTTIDGRKSWTYPSWDQAAGGANGVYDYNPLVDPTFQYGKQTSDGVFVGYITTRAVEEDGRIEYVAETDSDTLPYGTYVLRELEVPYDTGYLFDEVSMNWREDFGIGDDFDYVERYGEAGESPIWYSHSKDYRFQEAYIENQAPAGPYDDGTMHPLYYRADEQNFYIGAYHHTYADDPEHNTGQSKVGFRGEYYNRVVPTQAHKEELDNQYVDFTDESRFCVSNYVARGDLLFDKVDDNNVPLPYVPFLVTSLTTGESHVVVTDANGRVDTRQSAASRVTAPQRAHSDRTNANDYALTGNGLVPVLQLSGHGTAAAVNSIATFKDGYWVDPNKNEAPRTPDLDWSSGVWWHGRNDAYTIHAQMDGPHGYPDYRPEYNHNWYTGLEGMYVDNPVASTGVAAGYKEPLGALPYDDYIIQELPVEQRVVTDADGTEIIVPDTSAYKMVGETRFSVSGSWNNSAEFVDNQGHLHTSYNDVQNIGVALVELDLINRRASDIQTTLSTDKLVEIHYGAAVPELTLYDTVRYYNLDEGHKYTVVGELHQIAYDADDQPYDGGLIMTSEPKTFIPSGSDGSVEVPFTFNASELTGGAVVAFEYLYDGTTVEDSQLLGVHEDPSDTRQTVSFPIIGTTLTDAADGDKEFFPTAEVNLTDTIHYEGLMPNKMYTFRGKLMVVDENGNAEPARNADGTPIESEEKYGPIPNGQFVGDVDVTFTFTNPALAGERLVAYEYVYTVPVQNEVEELVASHENPEDAAQTVYSPLIGTVATDAVTGEHIGYADDVVHINDVVEYKNLVAGKTYEMRGVVMNKPENDVLLSSGGARQTGSIQFVAGDQETHLCGTADGNGHVSGQVVVPFELDGASVLGKTVVCFEQCVLVPGDEDDLDAVQIDVARHEDIADVMQSVYYPNIATTAVDDVTKEHEGFAAELVTIDDDVAYDTLLKGQEYTVSGKLMDKETGEAILDKDGNEITGSTTFTAGEGQEGVDDGAPVSGTVRVVFQVPGELVLGKQVVVFEEIYLGDHLIAVHADINDDSQTVDYPEIRTSAEMGKGGKEATAGDDAVVVDTVEYKNLTPGWTYRMSGVLINKSTGEPVLLPDGNAPADAPEDERMVPITGTTEFTPEDPSGTVVVLFQFNAHPLAYTDLVVFETCERIVPGAPDAENPENEVADEYILTAKHEDINDLSQTVSFREEEGLASEEIIPKVVEIAPELVPIVKTGDGLLLIVAGVALASAVAGFVVWRRRKTMK